MAVVLRTDTTLKALEEGMNLPDASCPPGSPLDFKGVYRDPGNPDLAHLLLAGGWGCLSGTSSQDRSEC